MLWKYIHWCSNLGLNLVYWFMSFNHSVATGTIVSAMMMPMAMVAIVFATMAIMAAMMTSMIIMIILFIDNSAWFDHNSWVWKYNVSGWFSMRFYG